MLRFKCLLQLLQLPAVEVGARSSSLCVALFAVGTLARIASRIGRIVTVVAAVQLVRSVQAVCRTARTRTASTLVFTFDVLLAVGVGGRREIALRRLVMKLLLFQQTTGAAVTVAVHAAGQLQVLAVL